MLTGRHTVGKMWLDSALNLKKMNYTRFFAAFCAGVRPRTRVGGAPAKMLAAAAPKYWSKTRDELSEAAVPCEELAFPRQGFIGAASGPSHVMTERHDVVLPFCVLGCCMLFGTSTLNVRER